MESLGARLRQERERQNMTLDQVAAATKIGTRMLKALEEDHFDQLPGGIFNKGFVRAYARHLSMDEEQAIADYLAATGASQPIKEPEAMLASLANHAEQSRTEKRNRFQSLPWDKLAALLVLIILGVVFWGRHRHKNPAFQQVHSPTPVMTPTASTPSPLAKASAPSPSEPSRPEPATRPVTSTAGVAQLQHSGSPEALVLLIQANAESWLEITADGKDILHELLFRRRTKTGARPEHEIVVKAGNIGGVDFTFNGKKLPPQGAENKVKTLRFDSSGLSTPIARTHLHANPA